VLLLKTLGLPLQLNRLGAQDARFSIISSLADQIPPAPDPLVTLLLDAAREALAQQLPDLVSRSDEEFSRWVHQWPGEHYRLLAGLSKVLRPSTIVEIGTFKGHGTLALLAGHPTTRVVTYDILPWTDMPGSALKAEDFTPTGLEQRIGDLADPRYLDTQLSTLKQADLIFVDGPKDGSWEERFCDLVLPQLTDRSRLIVFDDIRLLEMVKLWRQLPYPKLDATSLGHWSGTGLLLTGSSVPEEDRRDG
jgi:predicted O-methyltransferase YrrM